MSSLKLRLAKGRIALAIWQDLVDGRGFGEKYASVKRGIWAGSFFTVRAIKKGCRVQTCRDGGPQGRYRSENNSFPNGSSALS